jgi:hypothetical protein
MKQKQMQIRQLENMLQAVNDLPEDMEGTLYIKKESRIRFVRDERSYLLVVQKKDQTVTFASSLPDILMCGHSTAGYRPGKRSTNTPMESCCISGSIQLSGKRQPRFRTQSHFQGTIEETLRERT